MKRSPFLILVIGTNVLFLFLYIHKASQCMKQSYRKQELETEIKKMAHTVQTLTHQLYSQKSRSTITEFARTSLNMVPISITQVQEIDPHKRRNNLSAPLPSSTKSMTVASSLMPVESTVSTSSFPATPTGGTKK